MSESIKQINDRLVQDNVDLKCEAEGKGARIVELEAENERLKEMAGCDHPSSSGVDTTLSNNPMKVWRCDGCGFEFIEIWEPEMGLRYKEARWAERSPT